MTQTQRKVTLFSHTQISKKFRETLTSDYGATDGQLLALTAIRTCYSPNKPSEIVELEGKRYFGAKATDGKGGTDADRLIRMIVSSGHTSTLEGITFNFTVEGVSRALLAQLTRHRVGFSFSVQSQRYVRFGSDDKSGGAEFVMPATAEDAAERQTLFDDAMVTAQHYYDALRKAGVPSEDARAVLPNAASCNLVLTGNLRSLIDFYGKRKSGNGAQAEIAGLAEELRREVVAVESWTDAFFAEVGGRK